jgi:hypothetical protein
MIAICGRGKVWGWVRDEARRGRGMAQRWSTAGAEIGCRVHVCAGLCSVHVQSVHTAASQRSWRRTLESEVATAHRKPRVSEASVKSTWEAGEVVVW